MKRILLALLVLALILPWGASAQDDAVVVLWPTQPDSLFPDFAVTATAGYVMTNVYSRLVAPDLTGAIVGDLASGWEVSDDQLTWTFTLRDNANWHDGTPVTAADVKFTFEVSADPAYTGGSFDAAVAGAAAKQSGDADEVSGVQVIDDHTVSITTTEPNALVLNTIAQRWILPAHALRDIPVADLAGSQQATVPIGSGPYRVTEWRTDEAIILEAFADYHGHVAQIPTYIWKVVPEISTHYTELVTGAADISTSIRSEDFAAIQEEPGIATLQFPGVNLTNMNFNTASPYFSDVRVRQAVAYALDRQSMIAVGGGAGTLTVSQVHPSMPEFNSDIVPYPYDPERAAALLEEAGWIDADGDGTRESHMVQGLDDGSPFNVELGTWSNPLYSLPAQIIQQNLADVGLGVEISVIDFNVYFAEYLTATNNPDFQFGMSGWFNLILPPHSDLAFNFVEGSSGHSRTLWVNDHVTELLTNAPTMFDDAERYAAYHEAQAIVHEEVPYLYLSRLDNLIAYDENLVLPAIGNLRDVFTSIPQWSWGA